MPSSRDELIQAYGTLGQRAKDNERPLYLLIVRYSSLPHLIRKEDGRYAANWTRW